MSRKKPEPVGNAVRITKNTYIARQNALERDVKLAYNVYAYRAGRTEIWEQLDTHEREGWREGWREAIEFARSEIEIDPECPTCGNPLRCVWCD